MKKLLLLLVAVAVVFTGCENADIDDSQMPLIEVVGGEEALSLDFPGNGASTKTITFNSNYDWSAKGSDEWIKVSPESGVAGEECQVEVLLEANNTYDLRNGSVTLTIGNYSIDIAVTQQPKNGLTLSNSEIKLPQSGGAFDVTVLANVDFEYEIKANWIKAVTTRALAENKVRFEAEANSATDPRTGEIVFKGEGLSATLIVTQSQTNIITLSTSTIEMNGSGGEFTVDVSSNIDYKVAIESGCDWIQQLTTRAVTTSTLNFSVSKNETDTPRSATITVSGEGVKETITVTQEYKNPAPKSNEIWYTSTDGKIVKPYIANFGANIISNTYENGQGVIVFDGPISNSGNFCNCTNLTSIVLPDGITRVLLFSDCSNLTSINIPSSVTRISGNAFENCTKLKRVDISDLSAWCNIDFGTDVNEANPLSYGGKLYLNNIEITELIIPSDIVEIKKKAFWGCGITSVTIHDNVTSIGNDAFYGCTSLTSVIMGNSVSSIGWRAFSNCSSLTNITIPDSLTDVWPEAFLGCDKIITVVGDAKYVDTILIDVTDYKIPSCIIKQGTRIIASRAFDSCYFLSSITIPNSVISIGYEAFSGCSYYAHEDVKIVIPDSVIKIGEGAFSECGVTDIKLSKSLTSIESRTFYKSFIKEITIPNSVTSIGASAFSDCGLTSIEIPNSVTSIGLRAFGMCSSLTSITIPDSVTSIGDEAFLLCDNLTSVNISNSVTSIGREAFRDCSSLTSVTIPDSVTSIGEDAFESCSNLTSITIPDSVITIEKGAFNSCWRVTKLNIGSSVSTIGEIAFTCLGMTSVTIPDSVTSIGNYAFQFCESLKVVYCKPTTPPSEGRYMFDGTPSGIKIYVPRNSVEAYKSADGWSEYASSIEGYDF